MTGRYPMPRKILELTPIPSRRLSRVGLELLAEVDVPIAQQVGDLPKLNRSHRCVRH